MAFFDHSYRELGTFSLSGCLVLMMLLVLMPAHSQNSPATPVAGIEIINDSPQATIRGLVAFFVFQVVLLWAVMFSYLRFSSRLHTAHHAPTRHWWSRLRFHH